MEVILIIPEEETPKFYCERCHAPYPDIVRCLSTNKALLEHSRDLASFGATNSLIGECKFSNENIEEYTKLVKKNEQKENRLYEIKKELNKKYD